MIRLDVWLTLPRGENIKIGALAVADPDTASGALHGQFRYNQEYLEHPQAFPLDPIHLPLTSEIFDANRHRAGVHGVFEDSLPDDWGRRLMIRRHKLGRSDQRAAQLLQLLGSRGLGALGYIEQGHPEPSTAGIPCGQLQELSEIANKFEQAPADGDDEEFFLLFQAGSSPGGARPKAIVTDAGGSYLAKFASAKDHLDIVSLETAAMLLAQRAGVESAEVRLMPLKSKSCLLVKRFDISEHGGRNHLISMQTLLKADDYYNAGYRDLAEAIKQVSGQPGKDLARLYRQMVFNVMIGNTDDHLKNFLMLHDESGWRLSPAFDLVPNIGFNRDHVLRLGLVTGPPTRGKLLAEAKYFGIKRQLQAGDIIDTVHSAVLDWPTVFSECGVPEKDADIIGRDITARCNNAVK